MYCTASVRHTITAWDSRWGLFLDMLSDWSFSVACLHIDLFKLCVVFHCLSAAGAESWPRLTNLRLSVTQLSAAILLERCAGCLVRVHWRLDCAQKYLQRDYAAGQLFIGTTHVCAVVQQ